MRDHVVLTLNGQRIEVRGTEVFLPLTDFLRRTRNLVGSKIVCAEGDCGACSVLTRRPGDAAWKTICGCIATVGLFDNAEITTIEGLSPPGSPEKLSPLQSAFVACHGAQCGFCTPGFITAITGSITRGAELTRENMTRELVGNLCRCTGYDSILQSACSVDPATISIPAAATSQAASAAPTGNSTHAATVTDSVTTPGQAPDSAPFPLDDLAVITSDGRLFFKPITERAAATFRAQHPTSTILAGGTDVGVAINKGKAHPTAFLATTAIAGWHDITLESHTLRLAAAVTLEAFKHAIRETLPTFHAYLERFASPQIRMAGTVAGNIATGSPIGDLLPALIALSAEVELISIDTAGAPSNNPLDGRRVTGVSPVNVNDSNAAHSPPPAFVGAASAAATPHPNTAHARSAIPHPSPSQELPAYPPGTSMRTETTDPHPLHRRRIPLDTFYTGYRQTVMTPAELIAAIHLPLAEGRRGGHFYKISKRRDVDISSVSAAFVPTAEGHYRIAFGGVAATPLRLPQVESFLAGKTLTDPTLNAAADLALQHLTPISDMRGSAPYRQALIRGLFHRWAADLAENASILNPPTHLTATLPP